MRKVSKFPVTYRGTEFRVSFWVKSSIFDSLRRFYHMVEIKRDGWPHKFPLSWKTVKEDYVLLLPRECSEVDLVEYAKQVVRCAYDELGDSLRDIEAEKKEVERLLAWDGNVD